MDFVEPLSLSLSLSLSLTFESNKIILFEREEGRGGEKRERKKSLSLAITASSLKYLFELSTPLPLHYTSSSSLYQRLLLLFSEYNRVHTTSRDQRVRSREERERKKKRWTATISCSRRNWPSKRRGAVHVASTRSEAVSEFFFFAR